MGMMDEAWRESVRRTPEQERNMTATLTVGELEIMQEDMKQLTKSYYEALTRIKELVEKVDSYLNYVVETWMEDNKLAVQNGLRTEIAETFMEKMKDLFTESYIDVPESKVDLVDELAESVDELETKLNEQTQKVIDTTVELEGYKRNTIIREASRDLAETQVEKLKTLVEDVDFVSEEVFAEKVATIKEAYFKKPAKDTAEDIAEDVAHEDGDVSAPMAAYLTALRKPTY